MKIRVKHTLSASAVFAIISTSPLFADYEIHSFWHAPGERKALDQIVNSLNDAGLDMKPVVYDGETQMRRGFSERLALDYPPEFIQWVGSAEEMEELSAAVNFLPLPERIRNTPYSEILAPEIHDGLAMSGLEFLLPIQIEMVDNIIYNQELLAQVGYSSFPQDWKGFWEMYEALEAASIAPYAGTEESWVYNNMLEALLVSRGGASALDDLHGELNSSGELRENLQGSLEIIQKLRSGLDSSLKDQSWVEMVHDVGAGRAAFAFIGSFARSELVSKFGADAEQIGCAGYPGSHSVYGSVAILLAIDNGSEEWRGHFQTAVEKILSPETQANFTYFKGGIPVIKDVDPASLNSCSQEILDRFNVEGNIYVSREQHLDREMEGALYAGLHAALNRADFDPSELTDTLINIASSIR